MTEHEGAAAEAASETAMQAPNFFENPQALMDSVQQSLNSGVESFINFIPNLIVAVVLVVLGWIAGSIIGGIFRRILEYVKFEDFLKAHGIEDALGKVQVSNVLVQLTKYYIILVFVQVAVAFLSLGPLTDFLNQVVVFAPKVIGAILIAVVAAMIGELVKEKVLEVHAKESYMRLLGSGGKYVVIFLGLVVGLETVGFPTTILTTTFVTLVQAMGLAFGLAVGLAFGFGGQDAAKDWIGSWRKRLHL